MIALKIVLLIMNGLEFRLVQYQKVNLCGNDIPFNEIRNMNPVLRMYNINPLMPVGNYSYQFFICCPRDAVSRTANVERTVRH